jgi:hypothetical protein
MFVWSNETEEARVSSISPANIQLIFKTAKNINSEFM